MDKERLRERESELETEEVCRAGEGREQDRDRQLYEEVKKNAYSNKHYIGVLKVGWMIRELLAHYGLIYYIMTAGLN